MTESTTECDYCFIYRHCSAVSEFSLVSSVESVNKYDYSALMIQFESVHKHNHMSALTVSHSRLSRLATVRRTAEEKLAFLTG